MSDTFTAKFRETLKQVSGSVADFVRDYERYRNAMYEEVLERFSTQPGVTPEQAAQLRDALESDAELLRTFKNRIVAGQIREIRLEAPDGAPVPAGAVTR